MNIENNDSKLTKLAEEWEDSLWGDIFLHYTPEKLEFAIKSMYQSAEMAYRWTVFKYDARMLL